MRRKDLLHMLLAYAVVIAGGYAAVVYLEQGLLMNGFWADIVGTVIIFAFSRVYKNSTFYDAYWSVIPPLLAVYWACAYAGTGADLGRQALVLGLVMFWGIRLTANWAIYWPGLHHEDWRYAPIKENAGKAEFFADFAAIHFFPTLIVFASCLPIYAAVGMDGRALNWLDGLAFLVTFSAILIELIADVQLHSFALTKKPGEIMQSGLWRYSRHPNYFGEFGFWFGLMLFGLAANPQGWWWIVPGAVAMLLMFIFVSIPLLDDRSKERRPDYAAHMEKVSGFVPWVSKL
ncbi:MAG: DUF1295 domain-containing protein [Parvibaculales bacterium]